MKGLVTIEDVAKHLNVSISTIRAWMRQNYIPKDTYLQIAKTYRFDLDRVVEALTQLQKDEPPSPAELVKTEQLQLDLVVNPDKDL
jgi:hypothetical protein